MGKNNLPSEEFIIRANWILTMSDNGDIRDGAIHISDGKIKNLSSFPFLISIRIRWASSLLIELL